MTTPLSKERQCSFAGCGKRHHAKGLCVGHWNQARKGWELRPLMDRNDAVEIRFWRRVTKRADGYWIFAGRCLPRGHVPFRGFGEYQAHRVSWILHHGKSILKTMGDKRVLIRHLCNVPACVNPAHLALGTFAENALDARAAGTLRLGERHPRAKLTVEQVRAIREDWARGGESQRTIGLRYGVTHSMVSAIILNKTRTRG